MPISSVIFAAINMIVVFIMSLVAMVIYGMNGVRFSLSICVLTIPVLMIQTAVLGLGVGIIISSLTTKYRDLVILVSFGLSLWMYLTPVVYPLSEVPEKYASLIYLNPMSAIVQNFRFALLGVGSFEIGHWIISVIITVVLFLIGVMMFNNVEKTFMDTV